MEFKNQLLEFLRETGETDLPSETDVHVIMTVISDKLYKEQEENKKDQEEQGDETPQLNGVI